MIFGMTIFTFVHVLISLVGIASGLILLLGMLSAKRMDGMTGLFLTTTLLTSLTGFLFPFHKFMPSYVIGTISVVLLAIALVARYAKKLAGGWNRTYVITAVFALYLNVFVLIAQLFMKVPALHVLAPTQSEPPFLVSQVICMLIFIVLGVLAVKKFRSV